MATKRVLVADDNRTLAATVGEILVDHGFDVTIVSSGAQALITWRERPTELALLDVDLPDIGGLTIARRLTRRSPSCGVVLMSAGDPEVLVPRCRELGAGFLAKPFSSSHLLETVDDIFERHIQAMARAAHELRLLGPRMPRALLDFLRRR